MLCDDHRKPQPIHPHPIPSLLSCMVGYTRHSLVCVYSNSRNDVRRGSAVRNHCRTHPEPCVRPCCVWSVLRARVQFCWFDKSDATADVQWHCNHRPPLCYHYFPAQSSLGADILVYWIGKIVRTCVPGGSRTLDFLRARRAPYPLG